MQNKAFNIKVYAQDGGVGYIYTKAVKKELAVEKYNELKDSATAKKHGLRYEVVEVTSAN